MFFMIMINFIINFSKNDLIIKFDENFNTIFLFCNLFNKVIIIIVVDVIIVFIICFIKMEFTVINCINLFRFSYLIFNFNLCIYIEANFAIIVYYYYYFDFN